MSAMPRIGSHAVEREPGQSRRSFLRLAGGAGLVLAARDLPAVTPSPFEVGKRGAHSRISLSYAVVEAGATKPFSVLHLSDTHLAYAYPDEHPDKVDESARRCPAFGGRQEEALAESLAWAKDNVDYVVHTGDLVDFQSRANFDIVRKYWGTGVFGSMGNHEFSSAIKADCGKLPPRSEAFKAGSWDILKKCYPVDVRFGTTVVNGVNFICMDNVYGTVQPDQVERFRAEAKKGFPIVLCMHVPICTPKVRLVCWKYWGRTGRRFEALPQYADRPGSDNWNEMNDPTTRDFIAYLKGEPLLKAILAGHAHLSMQETFSPTCTQYLVAGNFLFHGREILFV